MSKQKHQFKIDDRVIAHFEGSPYHGSIVEFRKKVWAKVMFDDGDLIEVKVVNLEPADNTPSYGDDEESDVIDKSQQTNVGFNQYNIHWDDQKINFKFKAEGGAFYGWWRKTDIGCRGTRQTGYALDIHVLLEGTTYNIDSIYYHDGDPRNDMHSLDGDICAACNKWF
jgi:hypothetical protein